MRFGRKKLMAFLSSRGDKFLPEQEIQRRHVIVNVWITNDEIIMVHGNCSRIQNFGNEASYAGIFFLDVQRFFCGTRFTV
jgi:hypothetical protein